MTGWAAMRHDAAAPAAVVWAPYAAVIFDMDGNGQRTMHAEAWKRLFDGVLRDPRLPERSRDMPALDIVDDYRRLVDGRSREDGVRALLRSREVDLPTGGRGSGC